MQTAETDSDSELSAEAFELLLEMSLEMPPELNHPASKSRSALADTIYTQDLYPMISSPMIFGSKPLSPMPLSPMPFGNVLPESARKVSVLLFYL
jgi:hypothetical protein